MYDTEQLARPRSVRLSKRTDSLLSVEAARAHKTVSELIREKLESKLSEQKTAGETILAVADQPARRLKSPEREAFQKIYRQRHAA